MRVAEARSFVLVVWEGGANSGGRYCNVFGIGKENRVSWRFGGLGAEVFVFPGK